MKSLRKLNLTNLSYNVVVASLLALVLMLTGFSPAFSATSGAVLLAGGAMLPAKPANVNLTPGLAFMAIQKEIWVQDIAELVVPDSSFITASRDDSEGLQGRIVHLPQSGAAPAVQKNRVGGATGVNKRTDTVADYIVDEYTTDPTVVTVTEAVEASYNKRVSVMSDHLKVLTTAVAEGILVNWSPSVAGTVIRTTGASRTPYKDGQTGNRLKVTKEDFANAARLLTRMDVPHVGRTCLVDADMEMDMLSIPEFVSAQIFGKGSLEDGVLGRVFGFDIRVRSRTLMYNAASQPKDPQAATAATDGSSILFWHPDFVRRAIGSTTNGGINVFEQNGSPTAYGDVMSAMVRGGGKIARADGRGVIALVEANA